MVTTFLVSDDSRSPEKGSTTVSGYWVGCLRRSGSGPTPLQWRRRELALDTSQAYHPCGVCATAIISQSSSLLPQRPTARAIRTHTDTDRERGNEAETQADQETEAACVCSCVVRCCVCVRVARERKKIEFVIGIRTEDHRIPKCSSSIGLSVSGD